MTIIEPELPAHVCPLPWRSGGYGSTGHPDGTLFHCSHCGTDYIARPCYESYGPTQKWHKVHWWNRRLRKRIVAVLIST